jgi:GNAT superfamily N-acetyltransferase
MKEKRGVQTILGDRVEHMLYVSSLMVVPEKQGQGYASALVRVVTKLVLSSICTSNPCIASHTTDQADQQGRGTWLVSGNVRNLGSTTLWDSSPCIVSL